MLLLGVPNIIAACLSFLLTETSGKDLPQTMEDGEDIKDNGNPTENNNNITIISSPGLNMKTSDKKELEGTENLAYEKV